MRYLCDGCDRRLGLHYCEDTGRGLRYVCECESCHPEIAKRGRHG